MEWIWEKKREKKIKWDNSKDKNIKNLKAKINFHGNCKGWYVVWLKIILNWFWLRKVQLFKDKTFPVIKYSPNYWNFFKTNKSQMKINKIHNKTIFFLTQKISSIEMRIEWKSYKNSHITRTRHQQRGIERVNVCSNGKEIIETREGHFLAKIARFSISIICGLKCSLFWLTRSCVRLANALDNW